MTQIEAVPARGVTRAFAFDDVTVRSDGSGRIVEAYAAAFGVQTEIRDTDGHYREELHRNGFNRTIANNGPKNGAGPWRFGVLFNHGRTIDGTPAANLTMPIGVPLDVRTDDHGVFTVTEYLDNPLADNVLDAIKRRAIRSQSFSGRFLRSTRTYPQGRSASTLPLITRDEVAMREYGPAVFAAYDDAEILGTRAAQMFARTLLALPEEERLEWLSQFGPAVTQSVRTNASSDSAEEDSGTPVDTTGPVDTQEDDSRERSAHSDSPLAERIRAARIVRGME